MAWETTIGLEVHVELATKTKIFCGCSTAFGSAPNTQCCPICMGYPGTLPLLQKEVLKYAIKAGLALNCEITRQTKFDRKNYFYPDLPKAYQISQLYLPLCRNGYITIKVNNTEKQIRISEIHMEEDAGKLVHDNTDSSTFIDYNRCGVPLIEIVTAPDFSSADEVIAFLEKLKITLQYLGVSDCKMQEGSMRADINLSVRPAQSTTLGTRTEMKNINSFKAISRAISYETQRQITVLESNAVIPQETRRWDDNKGISLSMRSKEDTHDYRYFPEPDIPTVLINEQELAALSSTLPEFAEEKTNRYIKQFQLPLYDAEMITRKKELADFFEQTVSLCDKPKEVSNWILGELLRLSTDDTDFSQLPLKPSDLSLLIRKIQEGSLNRTTAKEIFEICFKEALDIDLYIKENNLGQIRDDNFIRDTVSGVLADNPKSVNEYLSGKDKVFAFLVGQVMRILRGKADPSIVNTILKQELDKLRM